MNTDKIKARIKALLAKGADASCTPAEREAFTAKAHAMLAEYQIDLGDLIDSEDPVDVTRGETRGWVASWEISLQHAVGKYYGCRTIQMKGYGKRTDGTIGDTIRVDFIGRESARITAELMYPFIRQQVMDAGRELFQNDKSRPLARHQRDVGNALVIRINALIPEAQAAVAATGVNALVPVERIQQVVDETYGTLGKGRKSRIGFTGAANKAAANVSLHRQATGSSALQLGGR